jgi:hypothetical protein
MGTEIQPRIMSKTTERRLARLAERASEQGRRVTPMQVAARILEQAVSGLPDE